MSHGGGGPRRRVSSMSTKCTRGAVPRLLGPLNPHEEEGEEPIRLRGPFFGTGNRPLVAAVAEAEALHLRARPARVWTKELRHAVLHVLLGQQSAREHANTETEKKKLRKEASVLVSQSRNGTPKGHLGAPERRTVRRDSEEDSQRSTGNGSTES